MSLRILFLGESWYGSCARACCYSLRRLGHEVWNIDAQTFLPRVKRRTSRALRRLLQRRLVGEYNEAVQRTARIFRPDLLLAFKGMFVSAETLRILRRAGTTLYNYYPDSSAFAYGPLLRSSLPEYDCVFYTKQFWDGDVRAQLSLRATHFVPHGYDPEIHRRWELDEDDVSQYGSNVVVIATHTPGKEALLDRLMTIYPELDLGIWGNDWLERAKSPVVLSHVRGFALNGTAYAKAIAAAKINLALLGDRIEGASQSDETTTRTFEIPACGGFMLHQRTGEVQNLFLEGSEVACFASPEEAAESIRYYVAHPERRRAIARAGHRRCVPAYSYENRMVEIIDWHFAAFS